MRIKVEVFSSSGCNKCGKARDALKVVAKKMGIESIEWCEIDVLDDLDRAVELGVLSIPSIAIDGVLVFTSLPPIKKLQAELEARIKSLSDK